MYQIEAIAAERQRSYLQQAARERQALRLRALRRTARRVARAERRISHARRAIARLHAELEL